MEATLGCLYRILASGAGLILDKSRSASVGRVGFVIPANQFPGNGMRERQLDPKDRRAMQRHHGRMYGLQVVNDQDVAHPWHRMPQLLWACNLDDGLLLLDTSHWQLIWPTRELNYIRQREQEVHDPTCLSVCRLHARFLHRQLPGERHGDANGCAGWNRGLVTRVCHIVSFRVLKQTSANSLWKHPAAPANAFLTSATRAHACLQRSHAVYSYHPLPACCCSMLLRLESLKRHGILQNSSSDNDDVFVLCNYRAKESKDGQSMPDSERL